MVRHGPDLQHQHHLGPDQHHLGEVHASGEADRGPVALQVTTRHGRALTSHYAGWIAADLSRWNDSKISRVHMVPVPPHGP